MIVLSSPPIPAALVGGDRASGALIQAVSSLNSPAAGRAGGGDFLVGRMRELWNANYSITDIGNALGISRRVVVEVAQVNGWPARTRCALGEHRRVM